MFRENMAAPSVEQERLAQLFDGPLCLTALQEIAHVNLLEAQKITMTLSDKKARMTIIPINGAARKIILNSQQSQILETLRKEPATAERIISKMNNNSESGDYSKEPGFSEFATYRPLSSNFYQIGIIEGSYQTDAIAVVEGLISPDGRAKLHDELNKLNLHEDLQYSSPSAFLKSGHTWGPIILFDYWVKHNVSREKTEAQAYQERFIRSLFHAGFICLGQDGSIPENVLQ
jgi:hypothetical protein